MMKKRRALVNWVLVISFAASLAVIGCSRHPNEQELQALAQKQQAANAAEQALRDCNNESASIENQLSQKKRELQRAEDEKESVKNRLTNWDN